MSAVFCFEKNIFSGDFLPLRELIRERKQVKSILWK